MLSDTEYLSSIAIVLPPRSAIDLVSGRAIRMATSNSGLPAEDDWNAANSLCCARYCADPADVSLLLVSGSGTGLAVATTVLCSGCGRAVDALRGADARDTAGSALAGVTAGFASCVRCGR
jgi:hypothetical protein